MGARSVHFCLKKAWILEGNELSEQYFEILIHVVPPHPHKKISPYLSFPFKQRTGTLTTPSPKDSVGWVANFKIDDVSGKSL